MSDKLPKEPTGQEWELLCEVCAHPVTDEMEICPECNSPIMRPDNILEPGRLAAEESKKAKRKQGFAYWIDHYSIAFVLFVLIGSLTTLLRVLNLANDDWMKNSDIFRWIYGYVAALIAAFALLFRLWRRVDREHEKHMDD